MSNSDTIFFSGGQLTGSSHLWGWEIEGSSNPSAEDKGKPISIIGNVITNNGQLIIGEDNTPAQLTNQVSHLITGKVDFLLDRLQRRLPEVNTDSPEDKGNPFADGRNPFGEGNLPSLPGLDEAKDKYGDNYPVGVTNDGNPFAGSNNSVGNSDQPAPDSTNPVGNSDQPVPDSTNPVGNSDQPVPDSTNPVGNSDQPISGSGNPFGGDSNPFAGGDNPFAGDGNPFAGGDNPFAGGGNPFAGGDNPFAGGGNPFAGGQEPSFDISQIVLGDSLSFLNNTGDGTNSALSSTQTLESVQKNIYSFTSSLDKIFTDGNTTPLQKPSDLLNLFRADMYSFNSAINTINGLAAGDPSASGSIDFSAGGNNPFASLFGDSNNPFADLASSGKIPFRLLNVVLDGLLPFNGSDNVFTTNEGDLPIGHGNKDFGNKNAAIGNANWNYGNSNASIGNGNWNWDFSHDNATIGNGNWNLDSTHDNKTIGNGNWYWNSTSKNTTLGNGNWDFGNDNTTLGNGNWDFGSNNTVIGNGNWVFTSNSLVIGNGNWSVTLDKSASSAGDLLAQLDKWSLSMGVKDATENLVNSLLGKLGEAFVPLTGNLNDSGLQTYNQLFLSQNSHG